MSRLARGLAFALCVASVGARPAAARDLPYFIMGPTIPFSDKAGAALIARLRAGEAGYREINRAVLAYAFRGECPLTAEPPAGADTEIALRVISPREALLFAVNGDDRPAEVRLRLRLPEGEYAATVHRAGAAPEPFAPGGSGRFAAARAARMVLRLGAGESRVVHIRPAE